MTETTDFIAKYYSVEGLEKLLEKLKKLRVENEQSRQDCYEEIGLYEGSSALTTLEMLQEGYDTKVLQIDALELYIEFVQKQIEYKKQPGAIQLLVERIRAAKSALRYNSKSRFESAQSSSGRSLTAMISREGESGRVLRLGSVAHCRQSFVVIDEIGELPIAEQSLLQGVMEEGSFTINKYGFNANVRADTTIIWTSNPRNATNSNTNLSFKDIPVRKQILDRSDLVIVQKPILDPVERTEFNRLKLNQERASKERKKVIANFDSYIRLHLTVVQRKYSNQEITLSEECANLLNAADIEMQLNKKEGGGSFRTLDTLIRLATVISKLKLKDVIDVSDAERAISYYKSISTVNTLNDNDNNDNSGQEEKEDLVNTVFNEFVQVLKDNPNKGLSIADLIQIASNNNTEIRNCLGSDNNTIRGNKRLRRVLELLNETDTEISGIKRVGIKPAVFMYVSQTQQS